LTWSRDGTTPTRRIAERPKGSLAPGATLGLRREPDIHSAQASSRFDLVPTPVSLR
jgi:hypothetical protein